MLRATAGKKLGSKNKEVLGSVAQKPGNIRDFPKCGGKMIENERRSITQVPGPKHRRPNESGEQGETFQGTALNGLNAYYFELILLAFVRARAERN